MQRSCSQTASAAARSIQSVFLLYFQFGAFIEEKRGRVEKKAFCPRRDCEIVGFETEVDLRQFRLLIKMTFYIIYLNVLGKWISKFHYIIPPHSICKHHFTFSFQ